jgi:phage/plasmid-like protein (TIGR03299 family)
MRPFTNSGEWRPKFRERGFQIMSAESMTWLRNNILVGFTDFRPPAWWAGRGIDETDDNGEANHYPGAIPVEDIDRRIFNYTVDSLPLFVPNVTGGMDDPEYVAVPNRQAITCSDNGYVMGIFKGGYEIHQPREFVGMISNILDDDAQVGSVGQLRNRAVSWVSVEVPENIVTPDGVEFRPNLFIATSHDGTMATTAKRCVTNIVCDNTMRAAMGEAGQELKIKHTRNSGFKIANAREALAIVHSAEVDFVAEVEELMAVKVTPRTFSKFLDEWSPVPGEDGNKRAITLSENRRATLTNLWKSDPRVAPWNGTGWGVVQAVNTFDQHFSSIHTAGDTNPQVKAGARFERSILNTMNGDLDKRTDAIREMLFAVAS